MKQDVALYKMIMEARTALAGWQCLDQNMLDYDTSVRIDMVEELDILIHSATQLKRRVDPRSAR